MDKFLAVFDAYPSGSRADNLETGPALTTTESNPMTYSRKSLAIWASRLTLLAGLFLAQAAFAQEEGGGHEVTFISIFTTPGPKMVVMWTLLLMSIAMVTFIIDQFIQVRSAKLAPQAVLALLRDALSIGNYEQAAQVCRANPSFISRVMLAAFENLGSGHTAVEDAVNEAFAKQAVRLKSRNNYLSVIGVVSPMIGLTGTVLGMMKAFAVLGSQGVANMTGLSAAISEVLIATAAGLIVAIPAFVFFYYFKNAQTVAFADVHAEIKTLLRMIPFDQLRGYQAGGGMDYAAAGGSSYGSTH
jgi:biopolymer transport protein ExbB